MKRVEVWHLLDDTVRIDRVETDGPVNVKILPDGRGYLKAPGVERLYRRVDFVSIDDLTGGDQ